jgi:hypothetical protein
MSGQDLPGSGENGSGIRARQVICSNIDGGGSFRVFPDCYAGNAKGGGFFLKAAGIGQNQG